MKTIKLLLSAAVSVILLVMFVVSLSSCSKDDEPKQNQPELEVRMEGSISHTNYDKNQTATISFTRFPGTVNEFKAMREKIGAEPQGAVALQLMAYEMYRRNQKIGTEVINLNNTTTNVESNVKYALKRLFDEDAETRPYQIAAFMRGATAANGYNPTEPYTIEIGVSPAKPYEQSDIFQATVIYLYIKSGVGSGQGTFQVLQTQKPTEPGENGKFFIVMNSIALNSRVPEKSFGATWNGLK